MSSRTSFVGFGVVVMFVLRVLRVFVRRAVVVFVGGDRHRHERGAGRGKRDQRADVGQDRLLGEKGKGRMRPS